MSNDPWYQDYRKARQKRLALAEQVGAQNCAPTDVAEAVQNCTGTDDAEAGQNCPSTDDAETMQNCTISDDAPIRSLTCPWCGRFARHRIEKVGACEGPLSLQVRTCTLCGRCTSRLEDRP